MMFDLIRAALTLPIKFIGLMAFLYLTYGIFLAPPGYLMGLL